MGEEDRFLNGGYIEIANKKYSWGGGGIYDRVFTIF